MTEEITTEEMTEEITTEFDDLMFGVRRSIRYHDRRVAFYEGLHKAILFMTLILGSSSIVTLTANLEFLLEFSRDEIFDLLQLLPPALISVLVSIDLVVGTTGKTRLHNGLKQQFISLESKMQRGCEEDSNKLKEWKSERLSIEANEPPVLRVLDTLCHNELLRAEGHTNHYVRVGFIQRTFAQFRDINADAL